MVVSAPDTLDTSGALLEGIRVATGNAGFTYPPRTFVSDSEAFGSIAARAEYMIVAHHPSRNGTDIGDPDLRFYWSKNEGSVVRFDYDSFSRRWNTAPGGPPTVVGPFRNSPRLKVPVPDLSVSGAPFGVYIGSPVRTVTFGVQVVASEDDFTDPPPGTVQVNKAGGELNFSSIDLANSSYLGSDVYVARQSFGDRMKSKGDVGVLPDVSTETYYLFMNPVPGSGNTPRVRIGFRTHLIGIEVPTESALSSPAPGHFQWSADTGRLRFSPSDIDASPGEKVYYDGVFVGSVQLPREDLGPSIARFPDASFTTDGVQGITDSVDVFFFSNVGGVRNYFQTILIDGDLPSVQPPDGSVYVDPSNGNVYMSKNDHEDFGSSMSYVLTTVPIEHGVSVQFRKSGVNTSGLDQESDFTVGYAVSKQVITDNVQPSPFLPFPTTPTIDPSLKIEVDGPPGSTGFFVGELVDSGDPSLMGYGYEFDLENKRMNFSFRKEVSISLDKDSEIVKLPDSMIFSEGLEIRRNGVRILPGVGFDFDKTAGLLEFITPVGENDPGNIVGVPGSFELPNVFKTNIPVFVPEHAGKYLFVPAGPNAGMYKIVSVSGASSVSVSEPFVSTGSGSADVRVYAEIVADRFWQDFIPPFKKFSISRGYDSNLMTVMDRTQFSVLATTGQVNLVSPAKPGETFFVSYVFLDSPDEGVTIVPTNRTEYGAFKVRQESAAVTPGLSSIQINPSGRTVDTTRPIKVYVDGVTQEPDTFTFVSPGSITLGKIMTTEKVVVDYWVREATGGETNFNVLKSPIDVDFPSIVAGEKEATFNGDQTSVLKDGGAILVDGKDVVIVESVSYDGSAGVTKVVFEETSTTSTDTTSKLQACDPITGLGYRVAETSFADPFAKNTSTIALNGDLEYPAGTVITVNDDPYLVQTSKYDPKTGKTNVLTYSPAKSNYIIPRIKKTVRPVLFPGGAFETREHAHSGYPFSLAVGGKQRKVLKKGVDFEVGEGGSLSLTTSLASGDVLYAMYVGRVTQPAGTGFTLNYAHGIAPDDKNGLKGQRVSATYNLYAPDTFFYRVETVLSFIPELISDLKKSASSGGSSGPNISSVSTLKTKDLGLPGLHFDEQHYGNMDIVLSRMLRFYNDLANRYEDILANLDGRVVGGTSGRFRFDGDPSNPPRSSYAGITNDIDDRVLLYNTVVLDDNFNSVEQPVYGYVWQSNGFSRFFPSQRRVTAALNGNVGAANYGKVLGSLGVKNITSTGTMTSTRARAKFTSESDPNVLRIEKNGDPRSFVPPFAATQKAQAYSPLGGPSVAFTINSVSGTGPFFLTVSAPVPLTEGGIVQDTSSPSVPLNHFYVPGRDLNVNAENGQITNATVLGALQVTVSGNELVDSVVTFQNSDTAPAKIPVLFGLTTNDDGSSAAPPMTYPNETDLLKAELNAMSWFLSGSVSSGMDPHDTVTVTGSLHAGDTIYFFDGPNALQSRTVSSVTSFSPALSTGTVSPPFPFNSSTFNLLRTPRGSKTLQDILKDEAGVLNDNVQNPPAGDALIGTIDAGLTAGLKIMKSFGTKIVSGTGDVSGSTISDATTDFVTSGVTTDSLLLVLFGLNIGVYRVSSVDHHSVVIDPSFNPFPSIGSTDYYFIKPWSFISSKEHVFINEFMSKTKAFLDDTETWRTNVHPSGVETRRSAVVARQADVADFISRITSLLSNDDRIYESRYLWISSRIDKKEGMLVKKFQAADKRAEATAKLLADQQKLLVTSRLT